MFKPIRRVGLQVESVLSMGNCIYSVLLGTISALILHICTRDGTWSEIYSNISVRIYSLVLIPFLVAYYLVDWHDMNRAPYFDEKIGMGQVCRWILCIMLIGVLAVLAVLGSLNSLTTITAIYILFTLKFRDEDLGLCNNAKDQKETFEWGVKVGRAKTLWGFATALAFVAAFGGVVLVACSYFQLWDSSYRTLGQSCTLLVAWVAMLIAKWIRSNLEIHSRYKNAISQMLAEQEIFSQFFQSSGKVARGSKP